MTDALKCPKCESEDIGPHEKGHDGRLRCRACGQAFWEDDEGKTASIADLEVHPVPEELALKTAELSTEELSRTYWINAIPAALQRASSGKGKFWDLQAAIVQELKRRGLKAGDKLS